MPDLSALHGRRVVLLHVTAVCDDGSQLHIPIMGPDTALLVHPQLQARVIDNHPELDLG